MSACIVEHWQHWRAMKIVKDDISEAVIAKRGLWTLIACSVLNPFGTKENSRENWGI